MTRRVALSVIIPTHNTAEMTLQCCRAVVESLPSDGEVIVVDDASADGTAELLRRELPAIDVLVLPRNLRYSGAVNAGVERAHGEILLLLNSDTLVQPDAIARLLAAFAADSRLGVASAQLLNADGTEQWTGGRFPTLIWLTVLAGGFARYRRKRTAGSAARSVDWVSGAAMAVRAAVWKTAGPLSERYGFYAQDLELCERAHNAGWSLRIIDDARVMHRGGATVNTWRATEELAHDPSLLWNDLLLWGRQSRGMIWASAARLLMILAAAARVTARAMHELTLRGEAKRRSRSQTALYRAALRQLLVKAK